jgi:hypothetical protein
VPQELAKVDWMSILAIAMTCLNAWFGLRMKTEILQLRIYVSDNYVSKNALKEIIDRLEKLIEKLEQKTAR